MLRSTEMCSSARIIMLRSSEDVFMCNECSKVKMDDLPRPLSGGIPNVNIPTPPHPPHESGANPPRLSNMLLVEVMVCW